MNTQRKASKKGGVYEYGTFLRDFCQLFTFEAVLRSRERFRFQDKECFERPKA